MGSKQAKKARKPSAAIIIPDVLLIQNNCFNLNFFLKILIMVDKVYHHKAPPSNTPKIKNNSILSVGLLPKIEAPAKTATNTKTAIGLEAVRKKMETKSPNIPFFPVLWPPRICLIGLVRKIRRPT